MSKFCFECFHRSTIKTKAISVRYPVTSPTCQLTDHQLADTIGQNADILIDIIWTNRLATFRECIELISVVIKSLKVSASWRVGEVTLHLTDKKKSFTHGRSHVRVLSMRLSLPFHYPFTRESIWSYISLCEYFTLIYVCVNPRNRRIIKESIFFRIRHFIQRSFSRHECVNSRKERRNS